MRVVATIRNASDAFYKGSGSFAGFSNMTDKEKLEFTLNPAAQVPEAEVNALVGDGSVKDFDELKTLIRGGHYSVTECVVEVRDAYKLLTFVVEGEVAARSKSTSKRPRPAAATHSSGAHYVPKLTAVTGMTEYQLMALIAQTIRDVDGGSFQADVFHPHARGVIEKLDRAMLTKASSEGYDG